MREFTYPVSLGWTKGRIVTARVEGKPPVDVATPPEFKGTFPDVWSPEDLLVAASASCYAVTLVGMAERAELPVRALAVEAVGRLGRRDDGQLVFVVIELEVELATDEARVAEAEQLAARAGESCLVSMALSIPVELRVSVLATPPIAA